MNNSSTAGAGRIGRAARSFRVEPAEVVDAGCRFVGRRQPAGVLGRTVLQRLVERVDQVPLGTLATVSDLTDATEAEFFGQGEPIPPLPEPIVDAMVFIEVMLARLSPQDLRAVSGDLALDRGAALRAAALVWSGQEPEDELREQCVAVLATRDCGEWGPEEIGVLRTALRLSLAEIGDAVLRVSEWQPDSLSWQDLDGSSPTAVLPVAGAPQPLEARLSMADRQRDAEFARELFGTEPARTGRIYRWQVGWRDSSETFFSHSGSTEASMEAARFAAEVTVQALATDPRQVRMPFTDTLLVPRTAATRNTDGRVIDLEEILVATLNQHRGERRAGPPIGWPMRPHRTGEADCASLVAVLFDHLCVPVPTQNDAACNADVDSAEFIAFLTAQAIALTPLARCYLFGMGDAGPGDRALAERHAAGMRAVLRNDDREAAQLSLELPVWRAGHTSLVDIEQLESYFATPDGSTS